MMKSILTILGIAASIQAQASPAVNPNITPNDPIPTQVLGCGGGTIAEITSRLEANGKPIPESGSAVVFKNGGSGVSYDIVPAIQNSRVGDHVLICLVFVPKGCPPGDDRGKIYTVTNLRTLESWTLPDSEHSCGGA
jgi:hypothetical protein